MILFLGDSFTWGQGLYYEKWKSEGVDVEKWIGQYGDVDENPHENLDYGSHQYRKQHHFPALIAKHYDRNYDVKWGNGGSNWDIIHQLNVLPALAPQFRNGLDLVVIQLTDWTRNDNRILYENDLYEQTAIPNINQTQRDSNWKEKLVDKMMEEEATFQIQKMKEILSHHGLKWLAISWRDDMGHILKNKFEEHYVPFLYENIEHVAFESCLSTTKYSLEEFNDGHLNTKGHYLVANSIIKKIDSIGGSGNFNYINNKNKLLI